jgi:phasin family protein
MADTNTQSKIDAAAEKAYAEAAAKTPAAKVDAVAAEPAVAAPAPVAAKKAAPKTVAAKKAPVKAAPKPAAKAAVAKKIPAKKPVVKKAPAPAAKTKTAAPKAAKPTTTTNPITKLKDSIMATAEKTNITETAKDMVADVQERVKTAYAKTGEFAGEFSAFNKGNVDAIVESGKIFFTGAQELLKDNVETGKTVVETVTEDAKKMVAVKSPTELMQLQGELARRNFDAIVSYGSKRTEAWVKLYNDAFAPISNRVSVATEKFSKAA